MPGKTRGGPCAAARQALQESIAMTIFTYPLRRGTAWLKHLAAGIALGLAAHGGAQAAIHVQATRVVYHGKAASASVAISNKSTMPYMRSEEHTSELQSLMRISYAVFCLEKTKKTQNTSTYT